MSPIHSQAAEFDRSSEEYIDQAKSTASGIAGDVKKRTEHVLKGAHKAAGAVVEKVSGWSVEAPDSILRSSDPHVRENLIAQGSPLTVCKS